MISSPMETIPFVSVGALVERLIRLCAARGAQTVVIGLPLSADGSEGPGCARARLVAQRLTAAGLRADLQDERWSSRDAEAILKESGKNRRAARGRTDAVAASLILRDYLSEASPP
jgi:putative Holliday junction resolvase